MEQEIELRVLEGDITVPYQWTPGKIYGRFLGGLKNKKILGCKCKKCKKVFVPPTDLCPVCLYDFDDADFKEVSDEGTVNSFTVVEIPLIRFVEYAINRPDPPYAIISIKLDGADTDLLHLVKGDENLKRLKVGARAKAAWRDDTHGLLLDIDGFNIV
ncbi:MAG: OB-fold domain-containing protein [bacterium]